MTSQQANEALAIYQANRGEPRSAVEDLLDKFFGRTTEAEYENQLYLVSEQMEIAE